MQGAFQSLFVRRAEPSVTAELPISASWCRFVHPRRQIRYDMHFALEMGLVLHGSMERRWHQQKEILKPGQIWLCGIWEPHGYSIVNAPCEVVFFVIWPTMLAEMTYPEAPHFNWMIPFLMNIKNRPQIPDALRPFAINLGKRVATLVKNLKSPPSYFKKRTVSLFASTNLNMPASAPTQPDNAAAEPAKRITDVISETDERTRLKLRVYLMEILLVLTEQWTPPLKGESLSANLYTCVNRAVELVFHQRRFISTSKAAHVCNMSRDAFCAIFKNIMGLSFTSFTMSHRLSSARNQLLTTPDPIKKIAEDWGFTDHCHFHHAFTSHYGCKPSAYKKYILRNSR